MKAAHENTDIFSLMELEEQVQLLPLKHLGEEGREGALFCVRDPSRYLHLTPCTLHLASFTLCPQFPLSPWLVSEEPDGSTVAELSWDITQGNQVRHTDYPIVAQVPNV